MCDHQIRKFWSALSRYRLAQASSFALQANKTCTDKEIVDAIHLLDKAVFEVLETPIGTAHQFLPKFEVVEELITYEYSVGQSAANYPVLPMASLRRDLLALKLGP
jgi:hypothetical protein